MTLWLDADATPRDVKEICLRAAERLDSRRCSWRISVCRYRQDTTALLVPKLVSVIDPRGEEYTAESIGERLSVRDFMDGLRGTGVETGGHAPYGAREKQAFANSLDRVLTRTLRRR